VANIKSQIKRNRQNEKRRLRNKSVKSSLKTAIRKFNEAVQAGDDTTAEALLRDASRKLDKAVSKGVIHKNQAANRKSAIAKRRESLAAAVARFGAAAVRPASLLGPAGQLPGAEWSGAPGPWEGTRPEATGEKPDT